MIQIPLWTSIAKEPYIFVIFQGGGGSGPPVPLWIRTCKGPDMIIKRGICQRKIIFFGSKLWNKR